MLINVNDALIKVNILNKRVISKSFLKIHLSEKSKTILIIFA